MKSSAITVRFLLAAVAALSHSGSIGAQPLQPEARVIVRLKADAALASKQIQDADRARSLSARTGLGLLVKPGPAPDLSAIHAPGIQSEELAALLAAQPDVEFAAPDRRKGIRAVPNDPLYSQQWLLQATQPAAIDAEGAWNIATGSSAVVIGVVDTGVRPLHEDLSDRLLPGFDFITDPQVAGDGDSRDTDAGDPGDFLTAADLQSPFFAGCGAGAQGDLPTRSSWHGTRVGGVLAASGNNSRGLAGVTWNSRLLPLRALGKCGGWDSDVLAAMRWAAGLPVPGLADNPNPVRILNLSLGGPGVCSPAYRETIDELRSVGVLVVASAGNSVGSVEEPANCPGVLAVGGLRHTGTKVGFSSTGPEVAISAPAGNCVNEGGSGGCLFQIPTTTNLGLTIPSIDGYSDTGNPTIGTSFSAPLVAGTAALMLSVHPGLDSASLFDRLVASARLFPQEAGLPNCPQVDGATGQCNCTTDTCGAGMLDAHAAVRDALRPSARAAGEMVGESIQLDGASSSASSGRTIAEWQWRFLDGPAAASLGSPQAARTGFYAPLAGTYRVELSVRDSAGATDLTQFTVVLNGPSVAPPPAPAPVQGGSGGGGGGGATQDWFTLFGLLMLAGLACAGRLRSGRSWIRG